MKHLRLVTIGGGTGMSTMLRGLKNYTKNLTAIVTMADDGGGSGRLREDLGVLPPGDVRNCLVALATAEPMMEELFHYRFPCGMLRGQSVGNLIIAAMDGICGSFEEAIRRVSEVLAISGRVLPVTTENIHICASLSDGAQVQGESRIGKAAAMHGCRISRVRLVPEAVGPASDVLESIAAADAIILGPGSLYTSILPNLLVEGVTNALRKTDAPKIYVCNVMGQPGETEGYTAFDHVQAIFDHGGEGCIDYCIVNTEKIAESVLARYAADGVGPVFVDAERFAEKGIGLIAAPLLSDGGELARHNSDRLAACIAEFLRNAVKTKTYTRKQNKG
ncbi:MAG: YvcK family protein [Ruminococcaceae bacterium]|nr:YvcK family protein [Oscillospiraceae bacterium]